MLNQFSEESALAFGALFPARITDILDSSGTWLYAWEEQTYDSTTGVYSTMEHGRSGTTSAGYAFELNNLEIDITSEPVCWCRVRGAISGDPVFEFDGASASIATDSTGAILSVIGEAPYGDAVSTTGSTATLQYADIATSGFVTADFANTQQFLGIKEAYGTYDTDNITADPDYVQRVTIGGLLTYYQKFRPGGSLTNYENAMQIGDFLINTGSSPNAAAGFIGCTTSNTGVGNSQLGLVFDMANNRIAAKSQINPGNAWGPSSLAETKLAAGTFTHVTGTTYTDGTASATLVDGTVIKGGIVTTAGTGTIPTTKGGTGLDGSGATNGQLLIGNGAGFSLNTLTAGANITITNGSGTITIASTGGATLADADYGDITVSSSGTVMTIDAGVVTYAKMQDVSATARVLARKTAGAGDVEECTLSEILDFVGVTGQGSMLYRNATAWTFISAGTSGDFLKTHGAGADPTWSPVVPANASITYAMIQDVAGLSVIGRATNSTGVTAAITSSTDHHVLQQSGTSLIFAGVGVDSISVTATNRLLGRYSASSGAAEEISLHSSLSFVAGVLTPALAAQSDQETGTSTLTLVTSGRQQYHASACKAWCNIDASSGTPTVGASYNLTSVTDSGVGNFLLNWDVDFSTANYAIAAIATDASSKANAGVDSSSTPSQGSARIRVFQSAVGYGDPVYLGVVAFGDQ